MATASTTWNPRGEPTWPNWRKAPEGTRFRHVRSGATGTFVKPARNRHNGAIVVWDPRPPFTTPHRANVVAPAFDLEPTE
jgi:hypothetical protein